MRRIASFGAIALAGLVLVACGDDDKTAGFASPADGDRIAGSVELRLTADGITIEEAGEVHDDAGHFHVLADTDCLDEGEAIAKDADHVHLGKGQAEGLIYLAPGDHELCVQVGDGEHHALDISDTVEIQVGADDVEEWCAVADEVDDLFDVTDNSSDDFATKQIAYENIHRLVLQMQAGLEFVDADAREEVGAALEFALGITDVWTEAEDDAALEEAIESYFTDPSLDATMEEAGAWISDTCNVDINN